MIKIGTRGSKLALWQAEFVASTLQKAGLKTEIVVIDTKGDQILDRSLSKIGSKGVFTEELEEQLRSGRIDIAQHSAKDLQSDLANDLELIAFTQRETVNDVLVSFNKKLSLESGKVFTVGTSSTRRVAMLKHYYPHIQTVDMRGNLQTRLQKLENGACDALLLAYAGVHRMGYDEHIIEKIDIQKFTPPVGQGSVAIECAKSLDANKKEQIRALLNHPATERCIVTERYFLKTLQGGCSIPSYGYATLADNDEIYFEAGLISLDGQQKIATNLRGFSSKVLGNQAANYILENGGTEILNEIKMGL